MLSVVIVLLPVVLSNWVVVPIQLWNFSANVGFDFAECEERPHTDTPGNPVGTCESIAGDFGDGALASFYKRDGWIFGHRENVSDEAKIRGKFFARSSLLTVLIKPRIDVE